MVLKDAITLFYTITYLKPNQTVDSDLYVVAVHIFSYVISTNEEFTIPKKPMVKSRIFSTLKYLSSISENRPKTEFLILDQRKEKNTLKNVNASMPCSELFSLPISLHVTVKEIETRNVYFLEQNIFGSWIFKSQLGKTSQPMNYPSFQFLV